MKFRSFPKAPRDPSYAFAMLVEVRNDADQVLWVAERDFCAGSSHAYATANLLAVYDGSFEVIDPVLDEED